MRKMWLLAPVIALGLTVGTHRPAAADCRANCTAVFRFCSQGCRDNYQGRIRSLSQGLPHRQAEVDQGVPEEPSGLPRARVSAAP
jgi:hypothetical protein